MFKKVLLTAILALPLLKANITHAGDISWSGLYRFEYFQSENLELDGIKRREGYFLQHLVMNPKFSAADGLNAAYFAPAVENAAALVVPVSSLYEVLKRVHQQ